MTRTRQAVRALIAGQNQDDVGSRLTTREQDPAAQDEPRAATKNERKVMTRPLLKRPSLSSLLSFLRPNRYSSRGFPVTNTRNRRTKDAQEATCQ